MEAVLVRETTAVIKHHVQKQPGEERVNFVYTFTTYLIIDKNQGRNSDRNLELGDDAEAIERYYLLASSS